MTEVEILTTGGCYDCGGRCLHNVHVRDGVVVRVDTDDGEAPQLRSCLRGRALRQHLHSPDRLRYPPKRIGPRGEGQFQRISWDEALDTVAREIRRIKEYYGPQSILAMTYSGHAPGWFHRAQVPLQFRHLFGQCTRIWGVASCEGSTFAARATYGTLHNSSTRDDLVLSRLIILWGIDPAVSVYGTNTSYHLVQAKRWAKEHGTGLMARGETATAKPERPHP